MQQKKEHWANEERRKNGITKNSSVNLLREEEKTSDDGIKINIPVFVVFVVVDVAGKREREREGIVLNQQHQQPIQMKVR